MQVCVHVRTPGGEEPSQKMIFQIESQTRQNPEERSSQVQKKEEEE